MIYLHTQSLSIMYGVTSNIRLKSTSWMSYDIQMYTVIFYKFGTILIFFL